MIKKLHAGYAVAVTAILLTAACGGDDDSDDETTDTAGQQLSDAVVQTMDVDGVGTLLVDADGNTLYTTEAENDGTVKCVDGCASFWPPLTVETDSAPAAVEGVTGEFSVIERPDGTMQLALDGLPLYTFADDDGPGATNGDGFEDDFNGAHFVWHAMTADGSDTGNAETDGGDTDPYDY